MIDEPKGQILPNSKFGQLLSAWAFKSETIVEIGTWHGLGSTLCLFNGLVRPTQRIYTIEPDQACYNEAKGYYTDPRIVFINDRAMNAIGKLPPQIDLLLIDGETQDADAEFDALEPRTKVIALDDTSVDKNQRNRKLLLDWKWEVIADCLTERHGWAMFSRK